MALGLHQNPNAAERYQTRTELLSPSLINGPLSGIESQQPHTHDLLVHMAAAIMAPKRLSREVNVPPP